MAVTVRNRKPRQNLQSFAAGGAASGLYSTPTSRAAAAAPAAGGNYVTPSTGTPAQAIPGSYSPLAANRGEPGITAKAQGLPSATPATGYTPGPQTNRYGSWGTSADANTTGAGAIPGDAAASIPQQSGGNYQRASTAGNYGAFTDRGHKGGAATTVAPPPTASYSGLAGASYGPAPSPGITKAEVPFISNPITGALQPGLKLGGRYTTPASGMGTTTTLPWNRGGGPGFTSNIPTGNYGKSTGGSSPSSAAPVNPAINEGNAGWHPNSAKGGAIPMKFDTGGAVPDPGGAIPADPTDVADVNPTTTGDTGQAGDPRQAVMQALSTSRQINGLNDAVFSDLSNAIHQSSGAPQTAMNTNGMRPSTNVEDNRQGSGSIDTSSPVTKNDANGVLPNINGQSNGPAPPWPYNGSTPVLTGVPQSGRRGGAIGIPKNQMCIDIGGGSRPKKEMCIDLG